MAPQVAAVFLDSAVAQLELPPQVEEVLPGVQWGAVDTFPTPAYWLYQVLARRLSGAGGAYRLGGTLIEEVAACLLGGHGMPAAIGVAAFHELQRKGLLSKPTDAHELEAALSVPLQVGERSMRYRFARQKSKYLAEALRQLHERAPPVCSGRALRNALLSIPGVGYKTASWVARNWLAADDVAILDIHIVRAGLLGGFFEPTLRVDRDYLLLEEQFLSFSHALGVRPSELDAVIWLEMANSLRTVNRLLASASGRSSSNPGRAHAHEPRLVD